MTPLVTQAQVDTHNKVYQEAWRLIDGEMHLEGKMLSAPSWFSRRRLNKARELFLRTIEINPAGWNAMFAIGKIEQRLGDKKAALEWFLKAREFEPINTSLAKEASVSASALGDYEMAARIVDEAIETEPDDPALRVNSGIAHLLAGSFDVALRRLKEAVELEPSRPMNSLLVSYTAKVIAGHLPKPKNEADIIRNLTEA